MKVLCLISSLEAGGAERVMLTLLQNFSRDRIEPILVLLHRKGAFLDALPEDIKVFDLAKKSRGDLPGVIFRLKSLIRREQPDVVLSFLWYPSVVAILANKLAGSGTAVIAGIRTLLTTFLRRERWGRTKAVVARKVLRRSTALVAVGNAVAEDMVKNFRVDPRRTHVIPNPVDCERLADLATAPVEHPWFCHKRSTPVITAVGRLAPEKGYPDLLDAFAKMVRIRPAHLFIIGEGQDRAQLERMAEQLGIAESVQFTGFQRNPFAYVARSDLYVLSSLCEGIPNALLEAMALAVPVVATACPSGLSDVVEDSVNGVLTPVGDSDRLCEAMLRVLNDRTLSESLGRNAAASVRKFSVKEIVGRYEQLIIDVVSGDRS